MKEYILTHNTEITSKAIVISILFLLTRFFEGNDFIFNFFLVLTAIIIIAVKRKVKYYIDDEKIAKGKKDKTLLKWSSIKHVKTSDWYIKFGQSQGNMISIIKNHEQEEAFEELKADILSKIDTDNVEIICDDENEGLKKEGSLNLLFILTIIALIMSSISIVILFLAIITTYIAFDINNLTPLAVWSAQLLLQVGNIIFNAIILSGFSKRAKKTLKTAKAYLWYYAISFSAFNVLNLVLNTYESNSEMFSNLVSVFFTIVYLGLIAGMYNEYLKTSERVKHYFVN